MTPLSPSYDNKIARKYSGKTLQHKVDNKLDLQQKLGWPKEKKQAIICLPMIASKDTGGLLLEVTLPGILTQDAGVLIIGKGESKYGELFTKLSEENDHKVAIMKDDDLGRRQMYAAADIALFTADPSDTEELRDCLRYGVVPVAPTGTELLEDYNPVEERGNSFLYGKPTEWHVFAAIVRAIETNVFPFDWRTIQRHAMESVIGEEE